MVPSLGSAAARRLVRLLQGAPVLDLRGIARLALLDMPPAGPFASNGGNRGDTVTNLRVVDSSPTGLTIAMY
jgi:hypothetical protein